MAEHFGVSVGLTQYLQEQQLELRWGLTERSKLLCVCKGLKQRGQRLGLATLVAIAASDDYSGARASSKSCFPFFLTFSYSLFLALYLLLSIYFALVLWWFVRSRECQASLLWNFESLTAWQLFETTPALSLGSLGCLKCAYVSTVNFHLFSFFLIFFIVNINQSLFPFPLIDIIVISQVQKLSFMGLLSYIEVTWI